MTDGPTLYDRTIHRLKNNQAVVGLLICLAVASAALNFTEQIRSVFSGARPLRDSLTPPSTPLEAKSRQDSSTLPATPLPGTSTEKKDSPRIATKSSTSAEFSRIILASTEHWEPVARDEVNYFYYREQRMSEGSPEISRDLEKRRRKGEYICPGMFANSGWCKKASAFFSQKGLQEVAIDPKFDVLVTNKAEHPVVLHAVGVEISYAEDGIVSLGDWTTKRVVVEGHYEIPMPLPPSTLLRDIQLEHGVDLGEEMRQRLSQGYPVTPSFIRGILSVTDWEWPNLPTEVWAPAGDPMYIEPGAPYRFEVVLHDYHHMPNNVVVRFLVNTNYGMSKSNYIYLLAM